MLSLTSQARVHLHRCEKSHYTVKRKSRLARLAIQPTDRVKLASPSLKVTIDICVHDFPMTEIESGRKREVGCSPKPIFFFFFRRFSPHLFWHAIAPLLKLKPAVIWTYCSIKAEWALSLWGVDSKSQIKISYSFIANQITTVASAGRVSFLASQAYVFGIYSECYKADFLHTVSNMKLHVLWINSISLCKYNKKKSSLWKC